MRTPLSNRRTMEQCAACGDDCIDESWNRHRPDRQDVVAGPLSTLAGSTFVATRMDTGMAKMAPTTTRANITDKTTRATFSAMARLDDSDFCPNGFASVADNGFSFSTFMDFPPYRISILHIEYQYRMGGMSREIYRLSICNLAWRARPRTLDCGKQRHNHEIPLPHLVWHVAQAHARRAHPVAGHRRVHRFSASSRAWTPASNRPSTSRTPIVCMY